MDKTVALDGLFEKLCDPELGQDQFDDLIVRFTKLKKLASE